jgi:glutamate N-acetyltransferase/amino-acid N-acetyltransferase
MICPDMATTLAFVLTDASVHAGPLRALLHAAAGQTFNRVTVDGDTSTNDALFLLASGGAGGPPLTPRSTPWPAFSDAVVRVLGRLATLIVADGEGAQHVVCVRVTGAATQGEAMQVARTVATSTLVKTALYGCDANWGRVLAAVGRSGVQFNPALVEIHIGDVAVARHGQNIGPQAERAARRVMRRPAYTLEVRLGQGPGIAQLLTSDLGVDYVRLNASYRT